MKLSDLLVEWQRPTMRQDLESTMSPTIAMPSLQNNDGYHQYRYNLALASARAAENNEIALDQESAWSEDQTVVCYTPQEAETVALANKLFNISSKTLVKSSSREPNFVNTQSPVRSFKDYL